MAENQHKVAIVVALIGVTGSLGAALLANWDKVFGRAPPAATVAQPAAPSAAPPVPASGVPSASPAPPAAVPPFTAGLTGRWRDSTLPNTFSQLSQDGNGFRYVRRGTLPNGVAFEATGSGTLHGRQLSSSYQARYANGATSSGTCTGSVAADGLRMDLQCADSLLGSFASTSVRE